MKELMNWLGGDGWTIIGSAATVLTLAATILIAVFVQRGSGKANKALHSILEEQRHLAKRQRLSVLLQTLESSTDAVILRSSRDEGRSLVERNEALTLERLYYVNPSSTALHDDVIPAHLTGDDRKHLVAAYLENLSLRYPQERAPLHWAKDVARAAQLEVRTGDFARSGVVGLVAGKAADGWSISHEDVRTILTVGLESGPHTIGLAGSFLHRLEDGGMPDAARINVLAGCSVAIIDYHRDRTPNEVECSELSGAAEGYAHLLHREALNRLGDLYAQERRNGLSPLPTLPVDECVVWMVHAIGLVSKDGWLARRSIEGLGDLLLQFPDSNWEGNDYMLRHFNTGIDLLLAAHANSDRAGSDAAARAHLESEAARLRE